MPWCCRAARCTGWMPPAAPARCCAHRAVAPSSAASSLPVAVQAILFDLTNGGEKDWLTEPLTHRPPYWDLGRDAALAAGADFALGTVGGRLWRHDREPEGRLGLGERRARRRVSPSARWWPSMRWAPRPSATGRNSGPAPTSRAANSAGWAGRRRCRQQRSPCASRVSRPRRRRPPSLWLRPTPRSPRPNASGSPSWPMTAWPVRCGPSMRPMTATRCLRQRTGRAGPGGDPPVLTELGTVAADCLARAIARGVYEATALSFENALPDWRQRFGDRR